MGEEIKNGMSKRRKWKRKEKERNKRERQRGVNRSERKEAQGNKEGETDQG